jgi:hypothetical protein
VNLAMLLGAKRIVLLGYDMKAGARGKKHHHPDHAGRNPTGAAQFKGWVAAFATMAPDLAKAGVEILNCSRETALDMFPRAKLEDVL